MKNKKVILEVTKEQYEKMRDKGISEEAILKPGKHVFKRVSPDKVVKRKDAKIRINICLDAEIVHHFRKRAEDPNAAPYQTQINAELRKVMEMDLEIESAEFGETAKSLLENEEFLTALAEKIKQRDLQTT